MYQTVHLTSRVSNISFGLPARKYINQAFLILAISAGMDSAILDPTNKGNAGSILRYKGIALKG
jgi:5-methyltetrahydrofolate corrinoid/iron sulfur protein methyltransferase